MPKGVVFRTAHTMHTTTSLNENSRNIVDTLMNCGYPLTFVDSYYFLKRIASFRQAVSTGLVASCAMCKERPRRTNERVCGRTCGERDRQARQVQGTYYGVPVVRREPRARPGA